MESKRAEEDATGSSVSQMEESGQYCEHTESTNQSHGESEETPCKEVVYKKGKDPFPSPKLLDHFIGAKGGQKGTILSGIKETEEGSSKPKKKKNRGARRALSLPDTSQ